MDWHQQGVGYFPYNQPNYPYPGYDIGGGNTGYVEFEGDDDDNGMYEPEEAVGPVQATTATTPSTGFDDATDPKPKPREPENNAAKIAANKELVALREKLLAQKKSATPSSEPKPVPATQESTMSADVDDFIAEERAAAEAANAKNTQTKVATPGGINGTPNKAPLSNSKQATPTTNTAQGRATPVSASSMRHPALQSTIKNNGLTGSPRPPQKTQQSQLTQQSPQSHSSIEPGEIRETRVGLNTQPLPRKEIAKQTHLRGGSNNESPKTTQTNQPERRDSNTDKLRDRQEPAASLPRQNNPRPQPNKNTTQSETVQRPTQATESNGERNTTAPNVNTTNREPTASTKQVQKDGHSERAAPGERQPEIPARRIAVPHIRNLESQIDSRNAAQRPAPEQTTPNAVVLSTSRTDSGHDQRPPAELSSLNAATHSHYFDDLDEWLEVTGYHDQQYRQKTLNRHRALAQLDREAERIYREYSIDEDDDAYLARPRPPRAYLRPAGVRRVASTSSMAPPPLPPLPPTAKAFEDASRYSNAQAPPKRGLSPSAPNTLRPDKQARLDAVAGAQQRLDEHTDLGLRSARHEKRPVSPYSAENGENGFRIRGVMDDEDAHRGPHSRPQSSRARLERSPSPLRHPSRRISYPDDRARRDEDERDIVRSNPYQSRRGPDSRETSPPRTHYTRARSPVEYHRSDFHNYRPGTSSGAYDTSPTYHNDRGRGRGYGRATSSGRGGVPRSLPREVDRDRPLQLGAGGVRYFMIKSWNRENVAIAQREGVWATQPHNEELLANAFKTCRHVILVFSVNKSVAFQGYARMQSAPGEAPTPSWTKNLLWPTSGPFYVRWITIADVRFARVGHLKNSLNEGLAVLVGRDGQEIEEECGRLLCESIDDVGAMMKSEDQQGAR